MTQDQIIQTLHNVIVQNQQFTTWTVSTPHLVALVKHAVEAEREECAKLCGELHLDGEDDTGLAADLIRARGNK